MTKLEKQMIIGVLVVGVLGAMAIHNIINQGGKAYELYKITTDAHKQKCLDKFKTIEYEMVNDVLYCKSTNGLVKY
jgi:hypothetical protein